MERFHKYTTYDPDTAAEKYNAKIGTTNYQWTLGDQGNFFSSIAFCDSGMFQAGITLNDTQVEIEGNRNKLECPPKMQEINYPPPIILGTSDRILKIVVNPKLGEKKWTIFFDTVDRLVGVE